MKTYTIQEVFIGFSLFIILMFGIGYIVVFGQGGIPLLFISIIVSVIFYFLFFNIFYNLINMKNGVSQNPLLATIKEKKKIFMLSLLLSLFLFEMLTLTSLVFFDEKEYTGKVFSKEVGFDRFGREYNIRVNLGSNRKHSFSLCYSHDSYILINQNISLYYKDTLFGIRFIRGYKRDFDNKKILLVGCF